MKSQSIPRGIDDIIEGNRRWWIVVILVAQPRRTVRYRPLMKRAIDALATIGLVEGSDRRKRDIVRRDLYVLENDGVVKLHRPDNRRQIVHVVLSSTGARRFIWGDLARRFLSQTRVEKSASVSEIASAIGVSERTVWRWFAGKSTPTLPHLQLVVRYMNRATVPEWYPVGSIPSLPQLLLALEEMHQQQRHFGDVLFELDLPFTARKNQVLKVMGDIGFDEREMRRAGDFLHKYSWAWLSMFTILEDDN